MYLPLMYCSKAYVCRLYEMLYPFSCNVLISCWKSGAYGIVICRGGTNMCFVPGSGWKHLDLEQYRISGLIAGCLPGGAIERSFRMSWRRQAQLLLWEIGEVPG